MTETETVKSSSGAIARGGPSYSATLGRHVAGFFVCAALMVLAVRFFISGALPFLSEITPERYAGLWPRRAWLLSHIAGGSLALFLGPFQLWSGLRRRFMRIHRWTGRFYVVGVVIGGSAAFYLASQAERGVAFRVGLGVQGVAWWIATGMAYRAIWLGEVSRHKEWVARSYVVTFAFVTFRWWEALGILPHLGSEPVVKLIWLSWAMPLVVVEVILQGRKMITRRSAV